jgi:citrate lyase subunit beta / citryl-CoA lyase
MALRRRRRPLRSLLFVPGNRPDRFAKAVSSGADAIIIDLEDSVPRPDLEEARRATREFLEVRADKPKDGAAIFVRTGGASTLEAELDIDAVCLPKLDGIVVPMVHEPADVRRIEDLLNRAEQTSGMAHGSVIILPVLETPQSMRLAYEIARASDRVAYMGGGTSDQGDVARGIGYTWTPGGLETLYIRSKILLDAKAAGIDYPVTGVWADIHDLDGFRFFAEQSKQLGYRGMIVIHPSHVPVANEVFSPSPADIAGWHQVIAHMQVLQAAGLGAGTLNGRLVDEANIKTAEQGLAWASALGLGTS